MRPSARNDFLEGNAWSLIGLSYLLSQPCRRRASPCWSKRGSRGILVWFIGSTALIECWIPLGLVRRPGVMEHQSATSNSSTTAGCSDYSTDARNCRIKRVSLEFRIISFNPCARGCGHSCLANFSVSSGPTAISSPMFLVYRLTRHELSFLFFLTLSSLSWLPAKSWAANSDVGFWSSICCSYCVSTNN